VLTVEDSLNVEDSSYSQSWDMCEIQMHVALLGEDLKKILSS
jgi:hypothetical protein